MPETDAEVAARLARRYPPPRITRLLALIAGLLAGVALLIWVLWAGWFGAHLSVVARVDTFAITADDQATLSITVERSDPSRAATCTIVAKAQNYGRVGEIDVDVPAGTASLTRLDVTVRTIQRATTVLVESCHNTP